MSTRKQSDLTVTPANSNTRVFSGRSRVVKPRPADTAEQQPRPLNSNTRISFGLTPVSPRVQPPATAAAESDNWARRQRERMVERLWHAGIRDQLVLEAMLRVPRHRFVDEALASRAYENEALPIGAGQTISQPRTVAYMTALARNGRPLGRVLEVGTGCGYQAAILAELAREVYTIERVRSLHEQARLRLRALGYNRVRALHGDGTLGWPAGAPYDAILVAAAGMSLPESLCVQLAVGGRLVAPIGIDDQRLVLIERRGRDHWRRTELEAVRFVPLKSGVQ